MEIKKRNKQEEKSVSDFFLFNWQGAQIPRGIVHAHVRVDDTSGAWIVRTFFAFCANSTLAQMPGSTYPPLKFSLQH